MKRSLSIFIVIIIAIFICVSCSSKDDHYNKFKGKDLYLKSGDKELFWFSGIHNNNPEHEMFNDIKKQFISFKPDFVLVEGNANDYIFINEKDAKLHGESVYAAYLSNKSNVKVESIEPPFEKQIQQLLKTYEEKDILGMYILRQINQIQRESQYVEFDFFQYIIPFVQRYITKGFSYSIDDIDINFIVNILEPHIKIKIDNDNWKKVDAYSVVYKNNGIIHSIYTDVLKYRDEYSIKLISTKLKRYNRIFIMMGADHIKAQEKELRKMFNEMY